MLAIHKVHNCLVFDVLNNNNQLLDYQVLHCKHATYCTEWRETILLLSPLSFLCWLSHVFLIFNT